MNLLQDWLRDPPVGFTHPLFLLLLPLLAGFYFLAIRQRSVPRGPWPFALWLRLAVALLLVLALSGLRLPAPVKSVATVFVVDMSDSVPADIREGAKFWVRQSLERQGPDDLAGIVTFGRDAHVEMPLGKVRDHAEWSEPPVGNRTDVGRALEVAASMLPSPNSGPLRRLVVLTDGNETAGDARRALLRPQLRDVEVAIRPLPPRLQDTAITSLSVPAALRDGDPLELRVAIASSAVQTANLRIWAQTGGGGESHLLMEQPIDLENGPRELSVSASSLPKGTWAFKAQLDVTNDSRPENNESWAYTIVGDPARVLLVEGAPGEATAIGAALASAKMVIDTIRPAQLAAQVDRLMPYETVVLANVHGGDLRKEQMTALQQFVGDRGRGLVVLGGERTFGLGDYADTPLEAALPVTVQPPDRDQAATLAVILVVDRSGSMSTADTSDRRATRMELAKEGAIQAVEALQEGDQVGVVAFDYTPRWTSEVRPIRGPGDVRAVTDRIAAIQPDGGTDIYAALESAYRGLQQVSARVKHVILLTDGEGTPAPYPTLLAAMRRAGITISAVGVASESGQRDLQTIARLGQGRYYFSKTAQDIPKIMTQEARLAGRSFKQERDFKPRLVTPAPAVRGLVPIDFPALHGYVRVSPKAGSETVLASDQEEVILSQWQYGLGRSVVWTADAQGAWSADWVRTDQFRQLWTQTARWSMRSPAEPGLQVSVRGDGEQAVIRVESFEPTGEFRNLLNTVADVAMPDGTSKRLTLPQAAPGRYEGRMALVGAGVYFLQVTQTEAGGTAVAQQTAGYAMPQAPEYQLTATNRLLMERIAAETGGPTIFDPQDSWRRDTRSGLPPQEVWSYLMMAALLLFVSDVAVRRLRPSLVDAVRLPARLGGVITALRRRKPVLPHVRLHPLQAGRRR